MIDPSLLPSLATFVQVAQRRSFTRAASDLDVSRAALSLSLKALEQKLGTRLLYRTTRDMSLTEEGQLLYDALQPALQSIDQVLRTLGKDQAVPSGLLRVNTSRIAAKTLLEPHMGEFMRRYPELRLELVMQDGMSNIVAEGCDAGILGLHPVSKTKTWVESFKALEALNPKVVVPGHGRVTLLAQAQKDTGDLLKALRAHMSKAVEDGLELSTAVKSFDAAPYKHLKHVEVWLPQLANRTYLEMELE